MKITGHRLIPLLIGLGIFSYTVYRAINLSFTHDESFNYQFYIRSNFVDILNNTPATANNHILNTLLSAFLGKIFGYGSFILRVPALIGHFIYLIAAYCISKRLKKPILIVCSLILLNFNPYFLDFFSLSRGYALAHAFLLLGFHFLLSYFETKKQKVLYFAFICYTLSSISVATALYVYVSAFLVCNFYLLKESISEKKKIDLKSLAIGNVHLIIVTTVLVLIMFEPIRKLLRDDQLYGGGHSGFWNDTVLTFIHNSFYQQQYFANQIKLATIIITVILCFAALTIVYFLIKKQIKSNTILLYSFLLLLFTIIGPILNHQLFNVLFLITRHTLIFYPLLILVFISLLYSIRNILSGYVSITISIIFASFLLFHFYKSANFNRVNEWIYDANTKRMLIDLQSDLQSSGKQTPVKLAIHWTFEPTINFYRETKRWKWLMKVNRDGFDANADYYYINMEDSGYLHNNHKQIIKRYPISNTILAKTP